jgi:c-di-GMP phosphodiesterase
MRPPERTSAVDERVFVARQAILDRQRRVFGYELLYRQSDESTTHNANANAYATARIVCEAVLVIGLETLADNKLSFINVDRQFLLDGIPQVLPPGSVAFELGPDVTGEADVMAACEALRSRGYALAMSLGRTNANDRLLELADFLKVDFSSPGLAKEAATVLAATGSRRATLIAKKIETREQYARALDQGYQYFQGFFFGQPVIKEGRTIPAQQLGRLRLLQALQDPSLTVHELEALVKPDPTMCYRILRTVNSAGFGLQTRVGSIREAVLMLGRDAIRRWASLWALSSSASNAPRELLVLSIIRARCCEALGRSTGGDEAEAEGFLIGICSLLDAILELPMDTVVSSLPLPDRVRQALLGADNAPRQWLECVTAYGGGEWDRCISLANRAGVDHALIPVAYVEALRWARDLREGQVEARL